jgi:hypothetical protein
MRRILVERSRRKRAEKRDGKFHRVDLDDVDLPSVPGGAPDADLLALDEALTRFAAPTGRQGEVGQRCRVAVVPPRGGSSDQPPARFAKQVEPWCGVPGTLRKAVDPAVTLVANSRRRSIGRSLGKIGLPVRHYPGLPAPWPNSPPVSLLGLGLLGTICRQGGGWRAFRPREGPFVANANHHVL